MPTSSRKQVKDKATTPSPKLVKPATNPSLALLSAGGGSSVVLLCIACVCVMAMGGGAGSAAPGVFNVFASDVGVAPTQSDGGALPIISSMCLSLLLCAVFTCIVVVVVRKAKERQLEGELGALMKELEAIEASANTQASKKPVQYDEIAGYTIPGIRPPTAAELKSTRSLGANPLPTSCKTIKQQCDQNPLCTHYEVWKRPPEVKSSPEINAMFGRLKPELDAMFGNGKERCVMKMGPAFPDQCAISGMNNINHQCGGGLSVNTTAYVHPRMYAMARKQGAQLSKWDIVKNRDVLLEMSKTKAVPTWKKVLSYFELAAIILTPLSAVASIATGAVGVATSLLEAGALATELSLSGAGVAHDLKVGKATAKLAVESQKLGIPIDNYASISGELQNFMTQVGTEGQPMGYCSNNSNERDLRADFRRINSIYGKPCAPFNCGGDQFLRIMNYRDAPEYKCKATDWAASPALLSGS